MQGNDEQIKKITETLLTGGKMLGIHCQKCKSPLFRLGKRIVCPLCGEFEKKHEKPLDSSLDKIDHVLRSKLDALTAELEKERDPAKSLQLIETIKVTLQALERLKKK
jgi:uncharacterized Zn finger protein (UPF0148 family)